VSTLRAALIGLFATSLSISSCARGRDAQPLAPVGPPAIGSSWVDPVATTSAPVAERPLLLRATDVDGSLDARIGAGRVAVPYLPTDAWMGAEVPTVTLVAFLDYECPFSQRLAATLYELVERYRDDLRVVIKHRPLEIHPNAALAAEAAVVAQRRGRFWPMHDALFENRSNLGREALPGIAGRVGLSIPEIDQELAAHSGADAVARDLDLAVALGVTGTPTSYVNGRKLGGAQPFADIAKVVDEELALAAQLQAAGAARHELYARFLHAAGTAPSPAPSPSPKVAAGRPDPALAYAVPVDDRPVRGPDDALVTVVMLADFQCPFSKRAAGTMRELLKAHPRDVRLVFRHHPLAFHPQARNAAKAAIAAGNQGKFWEMHDLLFEHQRELDDGIYRTLAKKLKLDAKRLERDMKAAATERRIVEDEAVAQRFGSSGTPAFFVNGRFVSGSQPLGVFSRVVEGERPKAQALREREAPADLYERLIADFVPSVEAAPGGE
jgi:protein-disulfide isomerase